jgi:guanylate kinase
MSAPRGLLVVISGPSGVGKSTLAERLLERPGFARAVTATTRPPRPGEVDGRDYLFLTPDAFTARVDRGEFLEHAIVHGRRYGTPRDAVREILDRGLVCLLVIDVQGAATLRQKLAQDALFVFLDAPSWPELERRLRGRGAGSQEELRRRLATAQDELARKPEFDAVVINDDLERAVGEIVGLVQSRRP